MSHPDSSKEYDEGCCVVCSQGHAIAHRCSDSRNPHTNDREEILRHNEAPGTEFAPTPPAGDWEKELYELSGEVSRQDYLVSEENHPQADADSAYSALKSFISTQIEKAKQDTLKEVGEVIREQIIELPVEEQVAAGRVTGIVFASLSKLDKLNPND